jgi:DnaJ-class molecular chaperone
MAADPYAVLGVSPQASDAELRSAYHRLAQLHHPDHNHGSADAARRFTQVQSAYAQALELRRKAASSGPQAPKARGPASSAGPPAPDVDARIAALEHELQQVRERARRAAAEAAQSRPGRATPEELGYVTTEDSFSKILDDASAELGSRFSRSPLGRRLADLLGSDDDDG